MTTLNLVDPACYGCGERFGEFDAYWNHGKACAGWKRTRTLKRTERPPVVGAFVLYRGEHWRVLTIEAGRMDGPDTADIEAVNLYGDVDALGFEDVEAVYLLSAD